LNKIYYKFEEIDMNDVERNFGNFKVSGYDYQLKLVTYNVIEILEQFQGSNTVITVKNSFTGKHSRFVEGARPCEYHETVLGALIHYEEEINDWRLPEAEKQVKKYKDNLEEAIEIATFLEGKHAINRN